MTAGAPRLRLRGRIALRFAAVLGVLGVALCVVGVVVIVNSAFAGIDDFARVRADGTAQTVRLDRGDYIAYLETPADGSHDADLGPLRIDGSDGPVDASPYGASLTYTSGNRNGDAKYSFTIGRGGDYRISVKAGGTPRGTTMAFGGDVTRGIVVGVVLFVPGLLLVMAAVGLLIAGLLRRSRHKRELASAYRGGGNGYFSGPPHAGWARPADPRLPGPR